MKHDWKLMGLYISLALELIFWALYLTLLLVQIGSPFADILWIMAGASGTAFGALNLPVRKNKIYKALANIAFIMGVFLIALFLLALFITAM